jgi:peroxiredoxin
MKWRSLEESVADAEARSLREIYSERKELIAKYVPAEVQAIHARVVEELKHSSIAERSIPVGAPAPAFELPDHNGKLVRSSELLDRGPLVICFFRGRWCPFCVGQLQAMNAILPQLQIRGTSLVGISPQTVHQSYLMADQHKLQFPLISDAGNQVAKKFGLVYCVPEHQQEIYSRAFVNLPFINGDASWELPIPATCIVGTDPNTDNHRDHRVTQRKDPQRGYPQQQDTIQYASANPDYTSRPEPSEILHFLAQLLSRP